MVFHFRGCELVMSEVGGHVTDRVGAISVADIIARGSIKGEDVARLARIVLADGVVDVREADTLIEMHRACGVQDAAWPPFFVEAITDYVVQQAAPEGYVNAGNARWLLARIAPDGLIASKAGLDLVVNVLDAARWAPVSLSRCALEQVQRAVIVGDGPLRSDRGVPAGSITPAEVALLRRILCGFGSDGHVAITRAEAEVLFAIDAAISPDAANACWTDLFVTAITNVVLTASGYAIPTRNAALAEPGTFGFDDGKVQAAARYAGIITAYMPQTCEERALARLERQRIEIITNEEILGEEASWLAECLGTGNGASHAERALIGLLSEHAERIEPGIRQALALANDRISAAA